MKITSDSKLGANIHRKLIICRVKLGKSYLKYSHRRRVLWTPSRF